MSRSSCPEIQHKNINFHFHFRVCFIFVHPTSKQDFMDDEDFGRLEHVDYDSYPSSSVPSTHHSPASKMHSTYSGEDLKKIGDVCKNRLPPAGSVAAMYLCAYFIADITSPFAHLLSILDELQRQAENEKLFQGHMFKLAEQETAATAEKERTKSLEQRLAKLEKQSIQDRVATSTNLLKAQGEKLNACNRRVETIDEKLAAVHEQFGKLDAQSKEAAAAMTSYQAEQAERAEKAAAPTPDPAVGIIKQEVDVLFLDVANILAMVKETNTRMTRLEDNLRALTLQRASQVNSPAPLPQRLPVTTSNGGQIDLGIPKGMAHVGLKKENAPVRGSTTTLRKEHGAARSFSPGPQWS